MAKCRYYKDCNYYAKDSFTCKDGKKTYCGSYRQKRLNERLVRNKNKKEKRNKD